MYLESLFEFLININALNLSCHHGGKFYLHHTSAIGCQAIRFGDASLRTFEIYASRFVAASGWLCQLDAEDTHITWQWESVPKDSRIDFAYHVLELCFCWVLAQRSHHITKLNGGDDSCGSDEEAC